MKLKFDQTGKRLYETGVSNVILFKFDKSTQKYGKGVAWNGVTAISESPEGGEDNFIYADDIKYLNLKSVEEWNGSITAYSSPKEFDSCDGTTELNDSGIKFGQQSRDTFAIVFKSRIGNDVDGDKHGYKLKVVYGLTATPSSRDHNTVNDSPEAQELSWDLSSIAVVTEGYDALSTVEINSITCPPEKMKLILNTLYGTDAVEAVYKKTTDTTVDPLKTYYTRSGSEGTYIYTPVDSPVDDDIDSYYEKVSDPTEDKDPELLMPDDFKAIAEA